MQVVCHSSGSGPSERSSPPLQLNHGGSGGLRDLACFQIIAVRNLEDCLPFHVEDWKPVCGILEAGPAVALLYEPAAEAILANVSSPERQLASKT